MTRPDSSHLTLAQRKVFFFRQAVDHVIEEHYSLGLRRSASDTPVLKHLRNDLLRIATNDVDVINDSIRLSVCFRNLIEKVNTSLGSKAVSTQLRDSLAKGFKDKEISCKKCAQGRSPCSQTDDDIKTIEYGGHCIARIQGLLLWARELSVDFYKGYAQSDDLRERIAQCNVHLDTAMTNDRPYRLNDIDYRISATSNYNDGHHSDHCVVTLKIQTLKLDWQSVLVSAHVLAHECVVHAFQGLDREPGSKRVMAAPDESCSEGWMEYVALRLVQKRPRPMSLSGVRGHAHRLHTAKAVVRDMSAGAQSDKCINGRAVAIKFHEQLLASFSQQDEVDFLALSARLNLINLDPDTRTDFVQSLDYLFSSSELGHATELLNLTKNFVAERITAATYVGRVNACAGLDDEFV